MLTFFSMIIDQIIPQKGQCQILFLKIINAMFNKKSTDQEESPVVDEAVIENANKMSVEQIVKLNENLKNEISQIDEELNFMNEKSYKIENLIKSQQKNIVLLNSDLETLNKELQSIQLQISQRNQKSIKQSKIIEQTRTTIEAQNENTEKKIAEAENDLQLMRYREKRIANLTNSMNFYRNFENVRERRNDLLERYQKYIDEMNNHTRQKQLQEKLNDLLAENQQLIDLRQTRFQQQNTLNKLKRKSEKLDKDISIMEEIDQDTKQIEEEIEIRKKFPNFSIISKIYGIDAQETQELSLYQTAECQTDAPSINRLTDNDIKEKIIEVDRDINQITQRMKTEREDLLKMVITLRNQSTEIVQNCNELIELMTKEN